MKLNFIIFILFILNLLTSACTRHELAINKMSAESIKYEYLSSNVPTSFEKSNTWNDKGTCPANSTMTPFAKYRAEAGDRGSRNGFTTYYGRSCAIVITTGNEISNRKIASANVESGPSLSITPHGPFAWWYENGKLMTEGSFENGAVSGHWQDYDFDGTPENKQ